jgi:phage terminase large subunit-like protein
MFSSESEGIDGYKPSLAVIDEYFCFPSDRPITAMRYGSRARENGLVLIITTAGTDISLPAYDEFQKVQKILNGVLDDDAYFGIIYSTDSDDDWKNESSFIKANPSIDTIIDRKVLKQDLEDALGQTSHQSDYKAKTLNLWTNDTIGWISFQKWETDKRKQTINDDDIKGNSCWCAIDLSSVNDFSVYTLCFDKGGDYYLRHKFYIPEEQAHEKYKKENIGIFDWIERGLVIATPGSVIDYDYIYKDIIEDSKLFKIEEIAYDQHLANELTKRIDNELGNVDIFPYPQGIQFFSNPTKQYEKLILEDRIIDCNPCSAWMVNNAEIKPDVNGNYKPLKQYKSSTRRIDSVITSIMSLDRCIKNSEEKTTNDFNNILALFN